MKAIYLAAGVAVAFFLANIVLYAYQPLGENFYIIGDSLVAVLAFMASIAGFYAFRLHGFRSSQGKAMFFFAAGAFFWFLGELTWGIYEIALGVEAPVGSIADVFWLVGYPMFILGFYYIFRISSVLPSKRKLAAVVPAMLIVFSMMVYLVAPIFFDSISLVEKMATAGYIIGDALLVAGLMFTVACLMGSRFAKPWSIILLSIILLTTADIYYANFFSIYQTGNLIDEFWNTGYILFGLGFVYYRETAKNIVFSVKGKKAKKRITS